VSESVSVPSDEFFVLLIILFLVAFPATYCCLRHRQSFLKICLIHPQLDLPPEPDRLWRSFCQASIDATTGMPVLRGTLNNTIMNRLTIFDLLLSLAICAFANFLWQHFQTWFHVAKESLTWAKKNQLWRQPWIGAIGCQGTRRTCIPSRYTITQTKWQNIARKKMKKIKWRIWRRKFPSISRPLWL